MYWCVFACFVSMECIDCIDGYSSVFICINVYWNVLLVLVCICMHCMYWSAFVCICMYCKNSMYCTY